MDCIRRRINNNWEQIVLNNYDSITRWSELTAKIVNTW